MLRCLFWVSLDLNVSNYPLSPCSAAKSLNHPAWTEAPIKENTHTLTHTQRPGHLHLKPHLRSAPSLQLPGSGRKRGQILAVRQDTWAKKVRPSIWMPVPCSLHVGCTWQHYLCFSEGLGREVVFHNLFFTLCSQLAMESEMLSPVMLLLGYNLQARIIVML